MQRCSHLRDLSGVETRETAIVLLENIQQDNIAAAYAHEHHCRVTATFNKSEHTRQIRTQQLLGALAVPQLLVVPYL
jgi:hypothetical protein